MGTGWEFDEPEGTAGAPAPLGDELVDPGSAREPAGSRSPSRRRLLLGAGALAAAGAVAWAVAGRGRSRQPDLGGPKPLWTYRGPGRLEAARITGTPQHPVFLAGPDLVVLDPATGRPRQRFELAKDAELLAAGGLLLAGNTPEAAATGTPGDRITGYDLGTGASDWQLLIDQPGTARTSLLAALATDGRTLYCRADSFGGAAASSSTLYAVDLATRQPRWQRPTTGEDWVGQVAPIGGGRLLVGYGGALAAVDDRDGHPLWSVRQSGQHTGWWTVDDQLSYEPDGSGLWVRSLSDGTERWRLLPGEQDSWRYLRPLPAGPQVHLFRDDGLVTAVRRADGGQLWTTQLPFRLDTRSAPALAGGLLLVPGPASSGVVALTADRGTVRWTFRDGEPGVDVWSVTVLDGRAYLGHDAVLHAVNPS
ncbi:PQQ-binding-like beta-propeller repeat protein [Kitasatospora sp. NPDC006697]|uniref:outer membrane protein assembly factor BamB family protein n=1 Tax=Kitasatospora sp. NPDC006697 TaxID=3364020 RepID=UPI0036CB82B3